MFTQLRIRDFKALESAEIDLARISIFIGPNNSGKTSALQALDLLLGALAGEDNVAGGRWIAGPDRQILLSSLVRIGSRRDSVSIGVSYRDESDYASSGLSRPMISQDVIFGDTGYRSHRYEVKLNGAEKLLIEFDALTGHTSVGDTYFVRSLEFAIESTQLASQPFDLRREAAASDAPQVHELRGLARALSGAATRRFWSGPFRGILQDNFAFSSKSTSSPRDAGEALSGLEYHKEVEERLVGWSQRIAGHRVEPRLLEGLSHRITGSVRVGDRWVNLGSLGSGSVQLVEALYPLAIADQGSVVGIEEPEIHLHPRAQVELVRVIDEASRDRNLQVLMTTHSEHILFGALGLVSSGVAGHDDIAVTAFAREGDIARATSHSVDKHGRLSGGLDQFFETGVEELAALVESTTDG